jgi:hypothetical protein
MSPDRSAFFSSERVQSSWNRRSTPAALKTRLSHRFLTKLLGASAGTLRVLSALSA